ncbi:MAG: hypothetical protein V1912_08770 [bacterium]
MAEHIQSAKPFNIRLPAWAIEYIDRRSEERGTTKTQVVVEALSRLRANDVQSLMRLGYQEMRGDNRRMAEEGMAASTESLTR